MMEAYRRRKWTEDIPLSSMILYACLGMAVGVMLASGIQIIRFYANTEKEQNDYEALAAISTDDVLSAPVILEQEVESDDIGFEMISTGAVKKKGSFLLMPVDEPTVPSLMREEKNEDKAKIEKPETQAAKSEPFVITHSQEGMNINFPKLYSYNPDVRGWIRIEGTAIDYPVVQSTDNEFYLRRNFYKQDTSAGCLFLDYSNEIDKDSNIVIYGHNMGRSSRNMFSSLLNYYDPSYYQTHRYILFDTIYGAGKWEIVSVFRYNIDNINEFNYTQQQFGSATEYQQYIRKIKELSIYDTSVNVGKDEKILTLSTCDRDTYGKAGRCVVVAKQIK